MTATEMTSESIKQAIPNSGKKVIFIQGISATNSDYITVTGLSVVEGAYVIATDGTVGTCTFATNIVTVTNGSTKTWSGLAWGY
jgi:hypothetical protein